MKTLKGFSLIEILVSVVILAVTALALSRFNAVQQQNAMAAHERLEATRLAERMMEGVLNYARTRSDPDSAGMDFSGITLVRNSATAFDNTSIAGQTSTYNVAVRFDSAPDWVDDAATSDDTLAFKTQVNVTWADSVGASQVVTISQDIYTPKQEKLAPPLPATCPAETSTFPVTAYSYYTIGSGTTAKLYYCKSATGCTGTPAAQAAQWTLVRGTCS
ncbi:hypothetical protein JHS3_12700 [Jeongeupia sp. HS-3]|uniref:type IV pilus modification PilV family protein n=1 Tax=Jeongeupia sp. HS-3 TaxID=1009682 RepID=UPI0018A5F8E8|nr:prepilin-type N-terminal cleavage/methylation domain-containing protein [Jeongeupia sp. HS-3]BCL75534.1 hypothetical protein JHS3_12700 [Jeongeupia sp. HS-3]